MGRPKSTRGIQKRVRWYRFWKTSGPNGGLTAEYFWYAAGFGWYSDCDKLPCTTEIECIVASDCEEWAGRVGGGFNSHYEYGFEAKDHPPKNLLKGMIEGKQNRIDILQKEIMLLSFEMPRSKKALDFIFKESAKHRVPDKDLQDLLDG